MPFRLLTLVRYIKKLSIYKLSISFGPVAEWLGSALQKLLQRFESARDLKKSKRLQRKLEPFLFSARPIKLCLNGEGWKQKVQR